MLCNLKSREETVLLNGNVRGKSTKVEGLLNVQ